MNNKKLLKRAKQMKLKHLLDGLSSDGSINTAKILTISELEKVNQASINAGLNRNIYFDVFKRDIVKAFKKSSELEWVGVDYNSIMLIPFMVHVGMHDKPHMRCELFTNNLIEGFNLVDVPMELFKSLRALTKKQYELFYDEREVA
tara:strand:- start:110 stop:547 length:438 start_codon:yes stop_codon:yes gene_type:complete